MTSDVFEARYGTDGQRLLLHVGRNVSMPSELGNLALRGYQGIPGTYTIQNGRIGRYLGNAPFDIAVYKIGDKYMGARSNEFGCANYEIVPEPMTSSSSRRRRRTEASRFGAPGTAAGGACSLGVGGHGWAVVLTRRAGG